MHGIGGVQRYRCSARFTYVMPPDNLVGPWVRSNLALEVDVVAFGDGGGINAVAEGQYYLWRI